MQDLAAGQPDVDPLDRQDGRWTRPGLRIPLLQLDRGDPVGHGFLQSLDLGQHP